MLLGISRESVLSTLSLWGISTKGTRHAESATSVELNRSDETGTEKWCRWLNDIVVYKSVNVLPLIRIFVLAI